MREYQNLETSDGIFILLDGAGTLRLFSKTWNLEMPPETQPELSEQEAINAAEEYLDINGIITT